MRRANDRGSRTAIGIGLAQVALGVAIVGFAVFLLAFPVQARTQAVGLLVIGVAGLGSVVLGIASVCLARRVGPVEGKPQAPVVSAAPPPGLPSGPQQEGEPALMLLSLLQEKGRFLDFVMEDITAHTDEQVSAATRVVHQGCAEVVRDAFNPRPVCEEKQSGSITLEEGFSAEEYRIVGNVRGEPPFKGTLLHKGWRAQKVKLPRRTRPLAEPQSPVIVPAEVEI